MRPVVFTENVVEGLKRWRATARKNLAVRSPYNAAGPPLEHSTDASIASSPSFNTLDVSLSIDMDPRQEHNLLPVDVAGDGIPDRDDHDRRKNATFNGSVTCATS